MEVACKLCLLTKQHHKVLLVCVPVCNGLACYATLDSCLGNGCTHFRDESRIHGFRYEVFGAESEVVNMINLINDIGYGLLCKIGNGVHGCHLHFLVDSLGVNVERTSEDVWETDDVVYLVGIVATSC